MSAAAPARPSPPTPGTKLSGTANRTPASRCPLLWATYVYIAGILVGAWMWRPPLWWLTAIVVFLLAAAVVLVRRPRLSSILCSALAFLALLAAAALNLQTSALKTAALENDSRFAQLADGRELLIVAHVIRDGIIRSNNPRYSDANYDLSSDTAPLGYGNQAQSVDVETESAQDATLGEAGPGQRPSEMRFAIRLNVYSPALHSADAHSARSAGPRSAMPQLAQLIYGQRLRFYAKLRRPRNFGNPGAFDYHGFLAQQGIVALASARSDRIELLPGFAGTRVGRWRSALRRSLLQKINLLWGPEDSALISAMLLGDRSGVDRETTLDYQRTGAYHILVGQGDSILVVSPQGRTLLIDGGGPLGETTDLSRFDFGEDVVSPYLWSRGITRLDAVALTHAHSDHIGGLGAVMENFRPRQLWVGPVPSNAAVIALWRQAQQDDVAIIRRMQGESFNFGGAQVRVLAPPRAWDSNSGSPGKSENNSRW